MNPFARSSKRRDSIRTLFQGLNESLLVSPGQRCDSVTPLARASVAVGCDGLMVEVHHKSEEALSDSAQALTIDMFKQMMIETRVLETAMGHEHIVDEK